MRYMDWLLMRAFAGLLVLSPASAQSANPMWHSGYIWDCQSTSQTVCERGGQCDSTQVKYDFELNYSDSRVNFSDGPVKIKRHYNQTVADSPLQSEVKVELTDNRVIWLTPVDSSRTYSHTWIGAIIESKAGVVLSITRSVYCSPASQK